MRYLFLILISSVLIIGCSNKKEEISIETSQEVKNDEIAVLTNFLKDVNSLTQVKKPIKTLDIQAQKAATKKMEVTKENIQDVLNQAANFRKVIIVVEDHTVVLIEDFKNCQKSGSWNACMPFAKGYIKKGSLQYKEGFCNFIIGTPNSQKRTAYFFK